MAVRVTRVIAEVAGTVDRTVRVTQTFAEVAGTPAQPDIRLYRAALMVLVDNATGTDVSASGTVTFSQSDAGSSLPRSPAAQTATFSQTASQISTFAPAVTQTITFSQTVVDQPTLNESANNTVTFSQSSVPSIFTQPLDGTITFSQTASLVQTVDISETHTVTFSQTVGFIAPFVVSQTVTFSDEGGAGLIIPGGVERSATQTVTFTHLGWKILEKATAQSLTGTAGTVTFSQSVKFPIDRAIQQALVFTEVALSDIVYQVTQDLEFSQVLTFNVDRPLLVTHTLTFNHAMIYENKIDTCRYSPTIGAGTDPNAPTPPPATFGVVTKATQVTLFYPTVSPTLSVIIRTPEYGDRHRLQFDRINRETRGGTLEVFADPDWPKMEILEASFTGLKESEAQAVLDFFTQTLGLEVGFTDWHGRTWHGVVMSPDAQLIRARRDIVDLSFEFEGEVQ